MKPGIQKFHLLLILGFALFRLVFVPFMGVMPQGAYYSFYSEHLSMSYYDHPPMIAYLLASSFFVLGKSAWVVKLTTFLWSMGTLLLTYKLGVEIYGEEKSSRSIVVLSSTIMFSILALVATPDVPLLFFWTASIFLLYSALFKSSKISWLLAGISMGLAFDSKYTAIFLPACLICFLVFSNEKRKILRTVWPYLSIFIMMIVMLPVFYWNYIHDFASFAFQGASRANTIADEGWKPEHILGSILMQSTVLIPVLFAFIFFGLYHYLKKKKWSILNETSDLFLLSFFLPVFTAFMFLSIMYWVKINWIMPAYITGVLFLTPKMSDKWFKAQWMTSVVLHLVIAVQLVFYIFPVKSDDTWWGWHELAEQVDNIQEQHDGSFIFAGDHYKTTAELNFYMDKKVFAHNVIGNHAVHYDMIEIDFTYLNGRNGIYIDSDPSLKHPEIKANKIKQLEYYFQNVQQLEGISLEKNNKKMRSFRVYLCQDYTWKAGLYKR